MRSYALPLALLLGLTPFAAQAQVRIGIQIGLPVAPRLEVISPGVSVVAGFPEEVFFNDGWYWCRRDDGWYRARSPRARFDWVEARRVPRYIVEVPRGHYRNWRREDARGVWMPPGQRKQMERREEHRDNRREEHRENRREDRREDRHDEHREHQH